MHSKHRQDSVYIAKMAAGSFNPNSFFGYGIIVGLFTVICVFFTYIEMMGQIFGREK